MLSLLLPLPSRHVISGAPRASPRRNSHDSSKNRSIEPSASVQQRRSQKPGSLALARRTACMYQQSERVKSSTGRPVRLSPQRLRPVGFFFPSRMHAAAAAQNLHAVPMQRGRSGGETQRTTASERASRRAVALRPGVGKETKAKNKQADLPTHARRKAKWKETRKKTRKELR